MPATTSRCLSSAPGRGRLYTSTTVRTVYTSAKTRAVVAVGLSFPVHSITVDFGDKGVMAQISIFIVAVDFTSPGQISRAFHPPGTTWLCLSVGSVNTVRGRSGVWSSRIFAPNHPFLLGFGLNAYMYHSVHQPH